MTRLRCVAENMTEAVARLVAERDENTCRKDMTWSELVAIGRRIEELERPRAEARQRDAGEYGSQGGRGNKNPSRTGTVRVSTSGNVPKRAETAEIVGQAIGTSASTYQRARTLVQAAEKGDEHAVTAIDGTPFAAPSCAWVRPIRVHYGLLHVVHQGCPSSCPAPRDGHPHDVGRR